MTENEYIQNIAMLKAIKPTDTQTRDGLTELDMCISEYKDKDYKSLGVTATRLIARYNKLSNYKSQNYAIVIIK